jgi:RNA polymerase sigma factor for flagellar operon FliA
MGLINIYRKNRDVLKPIVSIIDQLELKKETFFQTMTKTNFDEEKLALLWRQYKANPTPALKAVLAQTYAVIVRNIVAPMMYKKPPLLDFDDLVQAGNMGLLDAIDKYDPDREVLFQTYASRRIRGAVLDEINSLDWTPRSIRENIKGVLKSIEKHYEENQSAPTVGDIAERAEFDVEKTRQVMAQMNRTYMIQAEHETLDLMGPSTDHEKSEARSAVRYVMEKHLTDDERKFAVLKFLEGYSNNEIIIMMSLTPMSFKVLRESTIAKLTEGLKGYEPN